MSQSRCHFLMIQMFTHSYDTNGHTFLWQMDTRSNDMDKLSNDTDVHTFLWQMDTHSYDIDGHMFLWYRWSHVLTTQTGTYSYDTDMHNYDKEGHIVMTPMDTMTQMDHRSYDTGHFLMIWIVTRTYHSDKRCYDTDGQSFLWHR